MPVHHILFGFVVSIVWGVNFVVMKIGLALIHLRDGWKKRQVVEELLP